MVGIGSDDQSLVAYDCCLIDELGSEDAPGEKEPVAKMPEGERMIIRVELLSRAGRRFPISLASRAACFPLPKHVNPPQQLAQTLPAPMSPNLQLLLRKLSASPAFLLETPLQLGVDTSPAVGRVRGH